MHASGIACAFCLVTPGCWERCYDAEPSYQWDAVDTSDYCDGDQVKSRHQCTEAGEPQNASYVSVVRDCGAIGADCRAGVCVSRGETCPPEHRSFCGASGVRSCVGDAVAVDAFSCKDDQRCIEVQEAGVTRAQCALSDVPCSLPRAECDGDTLVSCDRGFPVSREKCAGLESTCVERPDTGAVCLAPQCEPTFIGSLCDGERIIRCDISGSSVQADCAAENKPCVSRADTAFCSSEGPAALHWQHIPGGAFSFRDHSSERVVDLPWFEILTHEVTLAQYQTCVEAGGCPPTSDSEPQEFEGDLPLVSVSEGAATQFCSWLGGRLPEETEWQYVATNLGTTLFPWGDALPSCALAVLGSPSDAADADCRGAPAEGCSVPGDQTALGVCDLAGNVSELVVIPGHLNSPYALGGNYETPADVLTLQPPELFEMLAPRPNTGFRCVR